MTTTEKIHIPVLDYGFVRLVDCMGDDNSVVRAARVSYNAVPRGDEDKKLIWYLWRNRHTTPFEHVQFSFEIQAPIFVFRQWHRHRHWSYNEVSGRYTRLEDCFYIPAPGAIGIQSKSNKQGRELESTPERDAVIRGLLHDYTQKAMETYRQLLNHDVPRELARLVLPLNVYTRMHASVNLHALLHFLTLRLDPHAQMEIRLYAQALLELIEPIVPWCIDAWRRKQAQELERRENHAYVS